MSRPSQVLESLVKPTVKLQKTVNDLFHSDECRKQFSRHLERVSVRPMPVNTGSSTITLNFDFKSIEFERSRHGIQLLVQTTTTLF